MALLETLTLLHWARDSVSNTVRDSDEEAFFLYWGLNPGPTPCAPPPALSCNGFFQDRGL
jgi:hypothetical protein